MRSTALKSKKNLVEGRSYLLNLILVAINASTLFLLLNNLFLEKSFWVASLSYALVFVASALGLLILKGFYMYSYLARFSIGLFLFISGIGILNDPIGFAELLNANLSDGALNVDVAAITGWDNFSLETYKNHALNISILLGILNVLLALMLFFHQLYKIGVTLTFFLFSWLSVVTFFNQRCDNENHFERIVEFDNPNHPEALEYLNQVASNSNVQLLAQSNNSIKFSILENRKCPENCACLGAEQNQLLGLNFHSSAAISLIWLLTFMAFILLITQFVMLPNSPGENSGIAILAWIAVLVHGILTSWFWIVFLSALTIYLALNFKRFGNLFSQNALLPLLMIGLMLFGLAKYVTAYEPLSDFRAYALGNDLKPGNIEKPRTDAEKIFVYKNKEMNHEVYLNEEQHTTSMIWEDTNYMFIRMHDFNPSDFSGLKNNQGFQPMLDIKNLEGKERINAFIEPLYQAYFEDMVEVRNKKTREVFTFRKNEFPKQYERDTNFVITKFSGVPNDVQFINMAEPILESDMIFIWITKDLNLLEQEDWNKIRDLNKQLSEQDYQFVALGEVSAYSFESRSGYASHELAYFNLSHHELMKICRSNTCLMVLKKGVVSAKYPLRGLPKLETILSKIQ